MYKFIFAYFYKMAVKRKNPSPRYSAAILVGLTILFHILLIFLSKLQQVLLIVSLFAIVYSYYNKKRIDLFLSEEKPVLNLKTMLIVLGIMLVPLFTIIILLNMIHP
jgi:hypothetical protein